MEQLVSIIIPAYQEEKKIGRCLESILASSYRHLELIVVNDGSTDRTAEIVGQFIETTQEKGPVIRLLSIPNGGLAHARNVGLRAATGQFIGFVDADDMIHPQMIERLAAGLQRGNDLAACGLLFCNEAGKPFKWQYRLREKHLQCPVQALDTTMWEQLLMSVSPALFWRNKIVDGQGELRISFPEEVYTFEDFAFVCRYLCSCDRFLEVQPFHGVFYCKHEGSLTTKKRTAEELYRSLLPIMDIEKQVGNPDFISCRLQYTFRFLVFWYEEASRCGRRDFKPGCKNWDICVREMERYSSLFLKSERVSSYKKLALLIIQKSPFLGRLLAKTIGKAVF